LKYAGVEAELQLLAEVARGVYELPEFDRYDVGTAYEIVEQYRDLRIGLADASIAVCAKMYDARDVLTLDERHFRALRPAPRKRFRILPADAR
jgi:predicted nucleic acid-binding protein